MTISIKRRAKTLPYISTAFGDLAVSKNSGKQRKNSEQLAVIPLAKPSVAQDFRQERDAAR